MALGNPKVVYGLVFRAASETLRQLGEQKLDAQLGILAVLHTWANDLGYHPHVHCLVTAGGLRLDGEAWVQSRPDFLFPQRVMSAMFRGKIIAGLKTAFASDELHISGEPSHAKVAFDRAIREAYRHRWVVHVEPPKGRSADTAAKYLARYVGGVAIGNGRMVSMTSREVSFKTRRGVMTLAGVEFVRRFAQHFLPRRFRKVRYFGLYAPGNVHTRWTQARQLLNAPMPPERTEQPRRSCPECGGTLRDVALPGVRALRPRRPPRARGPPW